MTEVALGILAVLCVLYLFFGTLYSFIVLMFFPKSHPWRKKIEKEVDDIVNEP